MRRYTITAGTFRQPDNTLLVAGDTIELDDADAQRFAHQLARAPDLAPVPVPVPAPSPPGRRSTRPADSE